MDAEKDKPFFPKKLESRRAALDFARKVYKETGVRIQSDLRKLPRGVQLTQVKNFQQRHGNYFTEGNRMRFIPVKDATQRRKAGQLLEPGAVLKTGVFVQEPKMRGVKITIDKDGVIVTANSKRRNVRVRMSAVDLARDPENAVRKAIGRRPEPKRVNLRVNGFNWKQTPMLITDFYKYMVDLDSRTQTMDHKTKAKVFSLELVYFNERKTKPKPKRK